MRKNTFLAITLMAAVCALAAPLFAADKAQEAKETLTEAQVTLSNFLSDPDMKWLPAHLKDAKAIVVVPVLGKGGFLIAGSGGVGVMLVKNADGTWGQPAYYRFGSVEIGLLVGGQKAEVIFFVQSQKGVDSFLSSSFKMGAGASVAAGPVGQGTSAEASDILSFSRTKGAYVGASFGGTSVNPAEDLNEALYKKKVTPVDILVRGTVKSAEANGLRAALAKVTAKK